MDYREHRDRAVVGCGYEEGAVVVDGEARDGVGVSGERATEIAGWEGEDVDAAGEAATEEVVRRPIGGGGEGCDGLRDGEGEGRGGGPPIVDADGAGRGGWRYVGGCDQLNGAGADECEAIAGNCGSGSRSREAGERGAKGEGVVGGDGAVGRGYEDDLGAGRGRH